MKSLEELHPDVVCEDGGLYCLGWYLDWSIGSENATLDGEFDADDLEAIADYMRRKNHDMNV